jgi:FKBP-type peptidyl-prolyl cis-trans isomerase
MKKIIIVVLLSILGVSNYAQVVSKKIKKNKEYTTESGLKFKIFDLHKKALKADSGDVISVHYVGKLADGTKFDASYDRKQPITFQLGVGRVIKGWDEGLQYLHIGDSALFTIPADIAYGNRKMGAIPANSTLFFTVKVVDIKKAIKPWDCTGLDTVKLDDNLAYIVVEKGKGEAISSGDKAYMQYSGYFTNGKKFDSSHDNGDIDFDFILGRGRVIKGWDIAVVGMKVGEKRRLLIPYKLAYGESGRAPIPPKSDLIFDIELSKFEKMNYPDYGKSSNDTVSLPDGLKYIVFEATDGAKPLPHDTVVIKYVARFMDGRVFDASYDRNDTLVFEVAAQKVIKGLDEGLLMVRKGEKVRFIIPYNLAYGENGREPIIPAKSDLIFDIYLQDVKKGKVTF